jgi:hypothetical protein
MRHDDRVLVNGTESGAPALRIKRLSSLDFSIDQALALSQSSLPQQQTSGIDKSGEGSREKLASATVRSSIVEVARYRLPVSVVSGEPVCDRDCSCSYMAAKPEPCVRSIGDEHRVPNDH